MTTINWPLIIAAFFGFKFLQECTSTKEELEQTKKEYFDLLQRVDFE